MDFEQFPKKETIVSKVTPKVLEPLNAQPISPLYGNCLALERVNNCQLLLGQLPNMNIIADILSQDSSSGWLLEVCDTDLLKEPLLEMSAIALPLQSQYL